MDHLPIIESCDGCGVCCMNVICPPFQYEDDARDMVPPGTPDRNEILDLLTFRYSLPEAPCIWYDQRTRRCRHYDHRPQICREFEMGSPECHEIRKYHGVV